MNTALNEVCIGWLHENCHLVRGTFFDVGNDHFFVAEQDSAPMYRVSSKGLEEGAGQPIPGGSNKQD